MSPQVSWDSIGAFFNAMLGTPDPQGRFNGLYANGQPPGPAAVPSAVPVAAVIGGAPALQIPSAVQNAPQGRQGRGRMPYKPSMAPSTGKAATPQQLNIPAQKPTTAQSSGGGSGTFGSEWINTLMGFLGNGIQDAQQQQFKQATQKTVPATSDAVQAPMSDAGYANQLGNRFLDLAGESNVRKAPDMMGTLESRFADRYAGQAANAQARQARDQALAASQPQSVPYAMPSADEYALRLEGRNPVQWGNPGVMSQADATQASQQLKGTMANGQQPIANQQQFISDLAGIGQSLGVSPTDPAVMQAYLQRKGRLKAPTTGNFSPSIQR